MKATLVMLAAMGISVIFYYAVNYFIGSALDSYFASSSYIERQTDKTAEEFQDYVTTIYKNVISQYGRKQRTDKQSRRRIYRR